MAKSNKRNKTFPVSNLSTARNKKRELEKEAFTSYLPTKRDTDSYEDVIAENKILKAEIQKLLKLVGENKENQEHTSNVYIQNRFETLNTIESTSTNQEDMESEDQRTTDFAAFLKEKNKKQLEELNNNKGKTRSPPKKEVGTEKDEKQLPQTKKMQNTHQEIRRKERPSPINILYQDPKDTTRLLQTNLKDMNNFYIKRISNGKHIL